MWKLESTIRIKWLRTVPVRLGQLLLLACTLVIATPALAVHPYEKWAQEFGLDLNASYDGTRVMEMEAGSFEAVEHKAPGKMYTEVHMGNMSSGIILREDLGKAYLLMTSMGMYKEDSLEGGMFQASNGMEFSNIEKVGSDEIIGFPSTKFKTKFKDKEGKGAGFIWVTDGGVAIKMDMIYSSRGEKGQRINMEFVELNMREQDPQIFELPEGLKPMSFGNIAGLGNILKQGGQDPAPEPTESSQATSSDQDMSAEQQACLEEAIKLAEEKKAKEKKKRAFGKLLGAIAGTAGRFGSSDLASTTAEIYSANATASTISAAAKDLGITEDEIERCKEPGRS